MRRIARMISRLENDQVTLASALRELGLEPVAGYIVGVTGPPGSGKSTLVDKLTRVGRQAGQTVAIVAVDPSSPFSGGALLGDRIRMLAHTGDPGVFVRSMAARRALGGLASASRDVAALLGAAGFDLVIIETVGVGQSELDIVRAADTVVVVTVPGLGDSVQTLKAGLMEIADIFVVNMADRPGVDRTVAELRAMLTLGPANSAWQVPIVETVATEGRGADQLWAYLLRHREHLQQSGELAARRRRRTEAEVFNLIVRDLRARVTAALASEGPAALALEAALAGEIDSRLAATRICAAVFDHPET
jgi:LAO/AO transport system kinase